MADDKIELRSEKIRNIIDEPPSKIICYGITIISIVILVFLIMRPLQNLHPLNFHPYTLRRMNIFDQKMPLEVIFE